MVRMCLDDMERKKQPDIQQQLFGATSNVGEG